MVFTKLLLENALAIRPHNCEAASEPLLPKVARCIPVLPSRYIGKCAARVLKRSGKTDNERNKNHGGSKHGWRTFGIFYEDCYALHPVVSTAQWIRRWTTDHRVVQLVGDFYQILIF